MKSIAADEDARRWSWRSDGFALGSIMAVWLTTVASIGIAGNFPLNDDWSYARAVERLLTEGRFAPIDWTAMPLLTHTLWGAAFSAILGFSYEALRLSTLAAAALGIAAAYVLVRIACGSWLLAATVALATAFNPVYYALSFTYMTDVFFTTAVTIGILFLVLAARERSMRFTVAATAALVVATLCRQIALFVPLAAVLLVDLNRRSGPRDWVRALMPLLACSSAYLAFDAWMITTGTAPAAYLAKKAAFATALVHPLPTALSVGKGLLLSSFDLGLFLLPLLALSESGLTLLPQGRRRLAVGISLAVGVTQLALLVLYKPMPLTGNVLASTGIGPLTLKDTFYGDLHGFPPLPAVFWWTVSACSIAGGACLSTIGAAFFLSPGRQLTCHQSRVALFGLAGCLLYLMPTSVVGVFDRYMVTLIPLFGFVLATIAADETPDVRQHVASGVALGGLACYAVFGTADYMALNRARWQALDQLMSQQQLPPSQIDGGFEFNAAYLYAPRHVPAEGKSFWWVTDDKYAITVGVPHGYAPVLEIPFRRLLPPGRAAVLAVRRTND